MKIIYLDLDGVCTNFIKPCIEANNLDYEKTVELWKNDYPGVFSAFKVLNIDNSTFWKNIEKSGELFWSEMEPYPWFFDLYNRLSQHGKVYFLTSPSQCPNSLSGKLKWLQSQFNRNFRDYIITPNKELLANRESILIDDYPKNIEKFNSAGGRGILFPQFWNSLNVVEDKVSYIIGELKDCTTL
jgi:5'(3')-deoxyribonucleotidase